MDNIKNYLEINQPIVYKTLKNAFSNNKTSHAYIISGAKGSPVLDIALFMAQSFVCLDKDKYNMACCKCDNCHKIANNSYGDFRLINGEDLKNDVVLDIQKEFNKSSLESEGVLIYIINLIEKAPVASLNKLLKFIEEPTSNIKAIFTSNSLSSIIPTIVSRCQTIKLKEFTIQELVNYLKENNIALEDASLLARISNDAEKNLQIALSNQYEIIKEILSNSLNYLSNKDDYFIVYMQNEGIKKFNDNFEIELYLDMLEACFFQALIKKDDNDYHSDFYDNQITKLSLNFNNIESMINDITIAKTSLISNTNKQLLFDKLLISLLRR